MSKKPSIDFYICPGCGDELAVGSQGCKTCAKKAKQRKLNRRYKRKAERVRKRYDWESEGEDGLDLFHEEDFDYDEFVRNEFGKEPHQKTGIKLILWCVVVLLLLMGLVAFFALGVTLL